MRLSVLSYNVLHNFGASRLLRARSAAGPTPSWSHDRLARVAELVHRLDPDVACLQEVDAAAEGWLTRALGNDYERAAMMRNEELPPKDGCTAFVRTSRFEVVRSHTFRLRDTAVRHFPKCEDIRASSGGMAAALWREVHEKLTLAVALHIRPRGPAAAEPAGSADLCVSTTHLHWDPKYPDLKLLQAFLLARELQGFAGERPLVLAGDLNSTPLTEDGAAMSGVYRLLTQGNVLLGHPHHPVTLRPGAGILAGVSKDDVPELEVAPFRSAYHEVNGCEGPITNVSRDFRGCLDYILYRGGVGRQLRPLSVWPLPSLEELLPQLPLPSVSHPSDHFPLLAEFELS